MACKRIRAVYESTQTNNTFISCILFISATQIKAKPLFHLLYGVQLHSVNHSSNTVVFQLSRFLNSVFPIPL